MAQYLLANPKKRRAKRKSPVRARKSPVRRRAKTRAVTKYRRNPIPRMGNLVNTMQDGAIGAFGAVATEAVMSKLPLPDAMQSGNGRIAAKAIGGVALGWVVGKYGRKRALGKTLAQGAVTVALHDTIRNMAGPALGLELSSDDLLASELLSGDFNDMGYYSAGATFDVPTMADYTMDDDF